MKTSGMSPLGLPPVQGSGECSISEADGRRFGKGSPSSSLTMRYIIPRTPAFSARPSPDMVACFERGSLRERMGLQEGGPLTIREGISGGGHGVVGSWICTSSPALSLGLQPTWPAAHRHGKLNTSRVHPWPLSSSFPPRPEPGYQPERLPLIHSFNEYSRSTYCVSGTILCAWDTARNGTHKPSQALALCSASFLLPRALPRSSPQLSLLSGLPKSALAWSNLFVQQPEGFV